MSIHIGELIRQKALEQRYSQQELGDLIKRTKQNVGDIYRRPSTDSELLFRISLALDCDFFAAYEQDDRFRALRHADRDRLRAENRELKELMQRKDELLADYKGALDSSRNLIAVLQEAVTACERALADAS